RVKGDRHELRSGVESECDLLVISSDFKGNIRAIFHAAIPVVFRPTEVDGDLDFILTFWNGGGDKGIDAITIRVSHMNEIAIGCPIALCAGIFRAAEFTVEAAGSGDNQASGSLRGFGWLGGSGRRVGIGYLDIDELARRAKA